MTLQSEVIQKDQAYSVPVAARPDFVLARGEGVTVYDTEGKAYTDWVAGIAVNALGYGDEELTAVVNQQLKTGLIHVSGLYHTQALAELAGITLPAFFRRQSLLLQQRRRSERRRAKVRPQSSLCQRNA